MLGKLKNRKDILAVYLFGSHARDKTHARSDIDICVIPKASKTEDQEDLGFIMDISKDFSDEFDFVNFYRLPIQIRYRVFKEGKEIFSKDSKIVHLVKFRTVREYLDMKPFLDRYYKEILSRGRKHG